MNKPTIQILLVEDDEDLVELAIDALQEKMPSARIIDVQNGPSALEKLGQVNFDIVLLDYSLPGMNGVEVLQEIKEQGIKVPVIMVSGQKNETIMAEAMKQGAQDYIVKSASYFDVLVLSVEKAIGHNQVHK